MELEVFVIEHRDTDVYGSEWRDDGIGDPNEFATEEDALAAIASLRALGGEWLEAEYRVKARSASAIAC